MLFDHEAIAEEVQRRFGAFFRERVNPGARERDRTGQTFSVDLLQEMAGLGLIGFTAPVEFGGGGRSWQDWGHALEEIGYHCEDAGVPMLLAYRETATNLIFRSGIEHLIERYAVPAVRGEAFIGWLLTEESDLWSPTTTLERRGDRLVLNGKKAASTGGMSCTSWIVYAGIDGDTVAIMVDRDDPGVVVHPVETMGLRSIGLAELSFEDVELDASRVLAPSGGLSHGQLFVSERRVTGASWLLGRMRALIEKTIDDTEPKVRFGRPLVDYDTFQGSIGRMVLALEMARASTYRALARAEAGGGKACIQDPTISAAKYVAVEQALVVADLAQRLTGGHGYFQKHGFDRFLRDFYGLVPILGSQLAIETGVGARQIFEQQRRRSTLNRLNPGEST